MDGERSNGGDEFGGDPEVEDEFACAGMLRGSLTSLHRTVERIFMVTFGIGEEDLSHGNSQIWLKLRGTTDNVKAAKLFVKGVVNQEEQQEVSYPPVLHCVFCGARGLFVDSLIRNTSAHIVVGSPGFLLLSGLAEPVVRAYSLIADLVERYKGSQSRRWDTGERGLGESLDSRRAFKTLVEKWDDRHTLDLLVLPGSVKEILLDLVKESSLGSNPELTVESTNSCRDSERRRDKSKATKLTLPDPLGPTDQRADGMAAGNDSAVNDSSFKAFMFAVGPRGWAEGAEEELLHSPQEVGEEVKLEHQGASGVRVDNRQQKDEEQVSKDNKDFLLLLKFFTAMGYTEEVVKRVLARTGPKEASQILDLVQQEQDRSDREQKNGSVPKVISPVSITSSRREAQPCETEDEETATEGVEVRNGDGEMGSDQEQEEWGATTSPSREKGSPEMEGTEQEEDFVLGVLKKAAVSCGYTEQNITKIYNRLPDGSTHQLLLELQKEESRDTDSLGEEPEIQKLVLEKGLDDGPAEAQLKQDVEFLFHEQKRESGEKGTVKVANLSPKSSLSGWTDKSQHLATSQFASQPKQQPPLNTQTQHTNLPEVKGPPMFTYPSALNTHPPLPKHIQTPHWIDPSTSKQLHPPNSKRQSKPPPQPQPHIFTNNDSSSTRTKERQDFVPSSSVVVTGEQRFLEGLQTPFELKLTDEPGDPELRTVIIDGSNVAMSHGLGHFFSCRGIALAIQHFWERGHRHISALVPQWRQKSDQRIKEQHYLTELQKLGLLSYTPSREVYGKRISSYDDRLILQLAQKTDGVIVTNDNLRDLSDESPVWRDIIKKRLLQYTFVGDLFMVPDDPLGRGGPHLDDFLRSEHRTPDPGNHSFAGSASPFLPFKNPRSQTEVLNFRDRTPGGALDSSGGGGRGRGRVHGKGWDGGVQHRPGSRGMMVVPDRTPEETADLKGQLLCVFLDQDNMVTLVLQCHPAEKDINVLSDLILEQQKN
nr:protein KHNYN [Nothobranchius furzeri]